MDIKLHKTGEIRMMQCLGPMTRGLGDHELREQHRKCLAAGETRFIIDLREVPYMDSAALGELVACYKRTQERAGRLGVVADSAGKPFALLQLASLDRVLDVHEQETEAIAAFDP